MLDVLNQTRAQYNVGPLTLDPVLSHGTNQSCVTAYDHSVHMAGQGGISHDQFMQSCAVTRGRAAAQNVGYNQSGNEMQDLMQMNTMMMSEAHDSATCSSGVNHACNIISRNYSSVGIGIYESNGTTWLTEDFLG
ncbi:MAG: hypothetical protein PVSMB7_27320 [Chloroflexota bacterium]